MQIFKFVGCTALILFVLSSIAEAQVGSTQPYVLVSRGTDTPDCRFQVTAPRLSGDGRWVFYLARCGPDASINRPSTRNVYGYDLVTGKTKLVSVLPNSRQGTIADLLDVNADGRYVVFSGGVQSQNVARDTPAVYVRDTLLDVTTKIDDRADIYSNASISADGQVVAFARPRRPIPGEYNGIYDTYVWNRTTGQVSLVNVPLRPYRNSDASAGGPRISADGRYVFFVSNIETLVPYDFNGKYDVFRRDLLTNTTELVSRSSRGFSTGNGESSYRGARADQLSFNSTSVISADGRFVVFSSSATDLVPGFTPWSGVYLRDMTSGITSLVSINSTGTGGLPADYGLISADGRFASLTGNLNTFDYGNPAQPNINNVYRRDLTMLQTTVTNMLYPHDPTRNYNYCMNSGISGDGRYELFTARRNENGSAGTNKVELYLRDYQTGATVRIGSDSAAAQGALRGDISAAGNTVVFTTTDVLSSDDGDGAFMDVYVYQIAGPAKTSVPK